MAKTTRQLEDRLSLVERELADLKAAIHANGSVPWYRQIVGQFAGDREYKKIIRLGQRIRRGLPKD